MTLIQRLRAVFLAPVLMLACLPITSSYSDELPANARYVPIERIVSEGRVNRTPYSAIVRMSASLDVPPDVWIPAELLKDMRCPVVLKPDKSSFMARMENPAETLGIAALKTLLPGQGKVIDIDFRALSDDVKYYFNMTGMERVTGIASTLVDANRRIVPAVSGDILVVGKTSLMPEKARINIPPFTPPDLTSPFSLLWDHVIKNNADLASEPELPSVKVISPTWFALSGDDGTISNKADWSYIAASHEKGWAVWALVSNSFKKDRTKLFLANASIQDSFIARMLVYARLYGFDGINIDFENVDNDDASKLTEFVRKLTYAAHSIGLVISIDLPVPSDWSKAYDRRTIATIVDYIAVMTYDEHWASAPSAGSTASLPWVNKAVEKSLPEVPPRKLLLGIPFYTREWAETKAKNGKISVRARTMAMASADARLEETRAPLQWLGDVGQNYFDYVSDDKKTYRIWVENERSMELRLALIKRFNLAGAAFWRKGFEKPEIWTVIGGALPETAN
ncbi:MAG: hypothetical protein LBT23_07695 [Synergistaceae bacterium]|jgi:spore germination protein YaaH|nr:hypothetical protein [Synergistaceae bacterium]